MILPRFFFVHSKDLKQPAPPTLAESRSQGWSDADHMPSLSMKVLTLHSACLLSQGFPLRLKISLASFFCLLQDPHIEFFHAMLAFMDPYWDANQVLRTVVVMERLSRPRAHKSAVIVWRVLSSKVGANNRRLSRTQGISIEARQTGPLWNPVTRDVI